MTGGVSSVGTAPYRFPAGKTVGSIFNSDKLAPADSLPSLQPKNRRSVRLRERETLVDRRGPIEPTAA